MNGLWLGLGTLIATTLAGLVWRHRQGRVRTTHQNSPVTNTPATNTPVTLLPETVRHQLDGAAAVTLLQLTTPSCAQCPQASVLLGELAAQTPGVCHVELDLAAHPELPGRLRVRSTPTTLAISRTGHELFRVTGVPRRAELLQALQPHL